MRPLVLSLVILPLAASVGTPSPDGVYVATATAQSETDQYTEYRLLDPGSARFRIRFEVTATTPGASVYYNPIRKGSAASEESVHDRMTGAPLPFAVVSGAEARKDSLMADADADTDYIRVTLARPVPPGGQARLLIEKTYEDAKSYHLDGAQLLFDRPLGVRRNKIVLPPGWSVVGLTVPSQIRAEADGRIAVSFMNAGSGPATLVIRARHDAPGLPPKGASDRRSWESPFEGPTEAERLAERAHQDRDIVYFLQQPESHAFRLYHDYTEFRQGIGAYANVVRAGSTASDAEAMNLDTGESLTPREMSGAELIAAKIRVGETVDPNARVVVIPFAPVKAGGSMRLRITETYTAPVSYRLEGDELVFERSLGRARNAVVLPSGWTLTASAAPATVSEFPDGRIRLSYWNDRPGDIDVLLKARRRAEHP
jgi:hypothetical protein